MYLDLNNLLEAAATLLSELNEFIESARVALPSSMWDPDKKGAQEGAMALADSEVGRGGRMTERAMRWMYMCKCMRALTSTSWWKSWLE